MMADMYDHASAVLVWLGEASRIAAEKAFCLIRKINEYVESNVFETELFTNPWKALVNVPNLVRRGHVFQDDSESEALRNLFCRPWFDRLWVLQEVALASSALVFYGATGISLTEVAQTAYVVTLRSDLQNDFNTERLSHAFAVFSTYAKKNTWIQEKSILRCARDCIQRSEELTFHEILETGRGFGATKPHDHVYAFLGHPSARTRDGRVSILEADYTLSIEEVYRKLSERLYERDQRLDFLCNVSHHDQNALEQAQSCVPTFHNKRKDFNWNRTYWNADNSADKETTIKAVFHNSLLHCRGLLFDSITTCTETFTWEDFKLTSSTPMEICWNLAASFTSPIGLDQRLRDLLWTMVGGGYFGGALCLQQDFESYCIEKTSLEFRASIRPNFVTDETSLAKGNWKRFEYWGSNRLTGRKFFITKDGRFGLGPSLLQEGDICCIVTGCSMPLILRSKITASSFKVLGPCQINGVMHGK